LLLIIKIDDQHRVCRSLHDLVCAANEGGRRGYREGEASAVRRDALRDAIERLFGRYMKTTHEGLAKVIGSPYRPCRRDAYYF
jgi:hypothetical protein